MNNNDYINAAASIFDFYTDEDWDEMFAAHLEDMTMGQELPDTKEWGLY